MKIFTRKLKRKLRRYEIVIADGGYNDAKCEKTPSFFGRELSSRIRARHETCNRKFKTFNCLKPNFRHGLDKHGLCFHEVANIIQMDILCGRELFKLN